jgi:hypothetical protein
MSIVTTMAGAYVATSAFNYMYKTINRIVVDTAIHNSVTLSLSNLSALLTNTKKLDHIDFNNLIIELDIDFKLEIIGGFLSDIKNKIHLFNDINNLNQFDQTNQLKQFDKTNINNTTTIENNISDLVLSDISSDSEAKSDPNHITKIYVSNGLSSGLKYLDQSLSNLHKILSNIKSKIEYHQTKYFNYYRSLDLSLEMSNIKLEYQILISRFDLILKIWNCI